MTVYQSRKKKQKKIKTNKRIDINTKKFVLLIVSKKLQIEFIVGSFFKWFLIFPFGFISISISSDSVSNSCCWIYFFKRDIVCFDIFLIAFNRLNNWSKISVDVDIISCFDVEIVNFEVLLNLSKDFRVDLLFEISL